MSFFAELKRRNVYRVAVLYVIAGWLILQVTDVMMSVLALPQWTGKLVFALLALGFPIALIFAWAFELTPEGVKRDSAVTSGARQPTGRRSRIDYLILGTLLLALAWFAWQHDWGGPQEPAAPVQIRSLVVLPLDNLMNDPDQAFFVAGMHEALITELSKIDALRVISRTSAMRFVGAGKSVPEIGRELGVDAVIEGSVLKAGDVVRIAVQLIEAQTDRHLWADNFDRPLHDILALYGEVTGEIARQVRVKLTPDQHARIKAAERVDPEVYELYLKGRYLCDNWSPEEMRQGVGLLQEAVTRDPRNAPANAQLALCLQYAAFFGYERPLDVYERSLAYAAKAVELDERLAEAHVARAGIEYYLEFRPRSAKQELDRALELNPSSVRALMHASWLLGESGRFEEGFERNRRAISLDPLSPVVLLSMGQLYYLNRDYEQAIAQIENTVTLDRDDPSLRYYLALAHEQLGHYEAAFELHAQAIGLSGGSPIYRAALGHAYARAGRREDALEILQDLLQDPAAAPIDIAMVHLGLGNLEQAMDGLEQAFEARDSHVIYINRGPRFDPLRNDPRFIAMLEKIDFLEPDAPLVIE